MSKNGVPVHLILDPKCLDNFNRGRMDNINLHPVLEYHCCEHVVYGQFTCSDHNFFVRARPGYGTAITGSSCPFNDGGRGTDV